MHTCWIFMSFSISWVVKHEEEDGSGLRNSASSLATSFCKCFTNFLSAVTWKYELFWILDALHCHWLSQGKREYRTWKTDSKTYKYTQYASRYICMSTYYVLPMQVQFRGKGYVCEQIVPWSRDRCAIKSKHYGLSILLFNYYSQH